MPTPTDLDRLYDEHAEPLYRFLLNLTRCEADTRDLLQQVFIKLARNPNLLGGARSERGYLISLAHHLAIDFFRQTSARTRTQDRLSQELRDLFVPTADVDQSALQERITEALGELPHEQRAVIQLKLWEGLTFDQIATALGLSLNTAASRYRYGLDKLRTLLRPLYDELHYGKPPVT